MPEAALGDVEAGVVGRESELAAAAAFLGRSAVLPAALAVEGEAGIGKTTIARALVDRARAAGLQVWLARPAESEAELPYSGLADLLATLDDAILDSLPGPQQAAIGAALARAATGTPVEQHALARGLLGLLTLHGGSGDLLLAVDDAQWLDRPTTTALAFALRRVGSLPVRLLVAIRTDARPVDIPFTLSGWNVRRVEVGPLETTALGALIRARLGEQLPRPRLEALWKASGGNPMFALELLRHGGFDRADGVQPTLPLALEGRLRSLEPDARAAVSTAAAALQPSIGMVLAAGVERAGLEAARAAGIVRIDGERIWFTHPLLASAAYELPLPDERRALHARLAELSTDPVERGHHVARSVVGCDERAAELLDAAAAEAGALGDHAAAASFLLRAADLSSDREGEASAKRQVAAARELTRAGDVECAAALCRGLVDRLPAGVTRGRARQTLNWCLIGAELSYVDALVVLERAMEDAADDALTCADISIEMAELSLGMCRLEEALAHARRAAELAESVGASMTAVHALAYVGFAESMLGHGVTKELRDAYARWNGSAIWTNSPRMILACACIPATLFEEAQDLFEQEIAWAQERGLEVNELISRAHLAETQLRAGRWAEGLANARLALEHARQATDAQVVTGIAYSIGMLEASLGHHAEARTRATSALVEAEATGDFWFTISHRAVLGQIALTENDPRTAVELLEPAWQLMLERGLGDLSLFPVAQNLGEAYSADSRLDDALHVASTLRGCPVGEEPWCRAMAHRIEGLVASARGDHEAARTAFSSALEAHTELPEPFEHARTLALAGHAERRARNWGAARDALETAVARFETLGAARWMENTRAEIARIGGRRPSTQDQLTTRELEVARLVAQGLANKEVAARLHVSLRTVEANLSKVYGKLGVRSRTELAAQLGRD